MPLLKRKPFQLLETPNDIQSHERVFQVRFTKEIFRDYQEYLKRIDMYRKRAWTCKVTGKTNLTYEEALVSEQQATEKVQQFPQELIEPVLRIVQYSKDPRTCTNMPIKLSGHTDNAVKNHWNSTLCRRGFTVSSSSNHYVTVVDLNTASESPSDGSNEMTPPMLSPPPQQALMEVSPICCCSTPTNTTTSLEAEINQD